MNIKKLQFIRKLGFASGTLTSIAFVPQVYQVYKKNSTKDLSLATLIMFFIGQVGWIVYGNMNPNSFPIELFGVITAVLYVYLIYKKISLDIIKK